MRFAEDLDGREIREPQLCAFLLSCAHGKYKVAEMRDGVTGTSRVLESRTCSDFVFDIVAGGVVMLLLRIKIAGIAEIPVPHMEPPQIFHYALGQEIRAHYDFLRDGEKPYGRDGTYAGDRLATFLLYLNDDYDGGDLEFPKASFRYRGRTGDGIFFGSQRGGKPDPMSLHAALPIRRGEKFILSQWIHDRPFAA
ncbi:MAG TPA: 2OG-Fe(II) oxygenase [Rhizomicrobium sp.]|nr:2OG-Fe(II) oxygenase [Rhizomicrobium sp.]